MAYNSVTLVPAYGRDYKSKRALLEDWEAGKDFIAYDVRSSTPAYINKEQADGLRADGYTHLHFRYNKQTLVHVVKL